MTSELPDNVLDFLKAQTGQDPTPMIRLFLQEWPNKERRHIAARAAHRFYEQFKDALFPTLAVLRREELVELVERYRDEGKETERVIVDMWLMGRFPPPPVVGVIRMGG